MNNDSLEQDGALARLSEARWVMIILAASLLLAVLLGEVDLDVALAIFLVSLMAVLIHRHRRKTSLRARYQKKTRPSPRKALIEVVETYPHPVIVIDRRMGIKALNKLASAAFSLKANGDLLTYRLRSPELLAAMNRVLQGGVAESCTILDRSLLERWYLIHIAPLAWGSANSKRPERLILVYEDLSEQHRLERMRSDFVANASHELRTPLASLSGFIDTLKGPARDDAVARDNFLDIMQEQTQRMARLIDDLLSLSRIELLAYSSPEDLVDLVAIVGNAAKSLEPLAECEGVVLELDLGDDAAFVRGDADALTQVFVNLIENAIKYGGEGKKVEISHRREALAAAPDDAGESPATQAVVRVRDFGMGIAPYHIPRLTERFYRVDADSSRAKRGTGLGLAIVKHILNRHKAQLRIDSAPGKGSTFTVGLLYVGDEEELKAVPRQIE